MSGDVQPRRRKDKKRKRDDRKSEGDVNFSRQPSLQDDESSHGVQSSHMGSDDVHIHMQQESHTGGHWCAKALFFVLMAVLMALVGMIISETRGLTDVDTPLSKSRYSGYLEGWVEENRREHDDHDEVAASIEEHEEHDEPFDEEEDHSEVEEENHAEDSHEGDDVDNEAAVNDEDENDEDDEIEAISEEVLESDDDEVNLELDDDEDNNEDNDNTENNSEDDVDDNEEDDDVDDMVNDEAVRESVENMNIAMEDDNANDDDENDDDAVNDDADNDNDDGRTSSENGKQPSTNHNSKEDDDFLDSFDEDDDATETVFLDNDAEELLHLRAKEQRLAEENAKEASNDEDADEKLDKEADVVTSYLNRLAVNIGVGVALALVARVVLLRKNPNTKKDSGKCATEESTQSNENLMKRRVTLANAEESFPEDEPEDVEEQEMVDEEEEEEEAEEEEEEIEYVEEEEIEIDVHEDAEDLRPEPSNDSSKYVPGTFEDYEAMYRPKNYSSPTPRVEEISRSQIQESAASPRKSPAVFTAPPPPPFESTGLLQPMEASKVTSSPLATATEPTSRSNSTQIKQTEMKTLPPLVREPIRREVTHDLDYKRDQRGDDDIDYDTDDDYDDDLLDEEEDEEDEEEGAEEIEDLLDDVDDRSDVDDSELMSRLEAKYGRLPSKDYESDEDPDDPTWTQLNEKPNTKVDRGPLSQDEGDYGYLTRDRYRGPQDLNEDIAYENEMARADDQLLRQHHGRALVAYSEISHKFPDCSRPFLAQAKIYDYLAKKHRHAQFLANAIEAYKRYLAFDELIENDDEYREAAESCIHGMRSLGYLEAAVTIHRMLVSRFPNDPEQVNQLVLTLLMMDRYSEAKSWLSVSSKRWPQNGLALVLLGYVLKMHDCEYHRAAEYLRRGIESRAKGTQEARFYIALGEVYERLGHVEHASATYKRGADLKLFPSLHQRSIYNQPNLRAQPVWRLEEKSTSYAYDLRAISAHWQIIRDEGLKLLDTNSNSDDDLVNGSDHFVPEAEDLLAAGNWQELVLFSRGERHERNCQRAPTTCFLIQQFRAAATCRRGQVKFSVMQPGTHVWSHCGPTNSRLRAHLGLVVPPRTRMRVVNETLNWIEGEFIIFDDSFEHEVWNEGEKLRLILIVDFWHPDLNEEQIQRLSKV